MLHLFLFIIDFLATYVIIFLSYPKYWLNALFVRHCTLFLFFTCYSRVQKRYLYNSWYNMHFFVSFSYTGIAIQGMQAGRGEIKKNEWVDWVKSEVPTYPWLMPAIQTLLLTSKPKSYFPNAISAPTPSEILSTHLFGSKDWRERARSGQKRGQINTNQGVRQYCEF